MSRTRSIDPSKQLQRLERKHQSLKARVAEFDRRSFLNAAEQFEVNRLKKQKLMMKDAMANLRHTV